LIEDEVARFLFLGEDFQIHFAEPFSLGPARGRGPFSFP